MENKTKKIELSRLIPGMILAKAIEKNGIKLLGKNVILTSNYIEKIKKMDLDMKIEVYDDSELEEQIQSVIKKSEEKFSRKKEILLQVHKNLKNIYEKLDSNSKISILEFKNIQEYVLEEMKDYSIILKSIMDYRKEDECLYKHCVNVGILSYMLGKWLGFSKEQLLYLSYTGFLHDIGKIKIDKEVLNKRRILTDDEFSEVKTHAVVGYEIAKNIHNIDESILMGILMHHERCDGTGYPLKIKGEKIHYFAKIVAIADEFDTMTSSLVYKKTRTSFEALKIIKNQSVNKLDYKYVNKFIEGIINCYIGEKVKLSNGKIAKIIKIDIDNIDRPLLTIGSDFIDLKTTKNINITDVV